MPPPAAAIPCRCARQAHPDLVVAIPDVGQVGVGVDEAGSTKAVDLENRRLGQRPDVGIALVIGPDVDDAFVENRDARVLDDAQIPHRRARAGNGPARVASCPMRRMRRSASITEALQDGAPVDATDAECFSPTPFAADDDDR